MKRKISDVLLPRMINFFQEKTKLDYEYLKKNILWVNLQLFGVRVIKLVYSVILVRLVSQEFYGDLNYVNSVFLLLGFFSLSGFGISVARALANNLFGTYKRWINLGFWWSLVGTLILLIFGIYNLLSGKPHNYVFMLLGLIFPFYYFFNRWNVLLQSIGKFKEQTVYILSKTFLTSAGNLLLLLVFRENLVIFVVGSAALFTILGAYYHVQCKKYITNDRTEPGWQASGYKLTFNNIFDYAYNTVDKIFLYNLIGAEGVAIYAVATIWPENIKTILSNNLLVYFPKIFRISNEHYLNKIRQSMKLILLVSILSLVASVVVIPLFILILYGNRYSESVRYSLVYSLVIPLHFLQVFSNKALLKFKKEEYLSFSQVAAGIVSILCYIFFIPAVGIMGAVIGSVMFYVVMIAMHLIFIKKFNHIPS